MVNSKLMKNHSLRRSALVHLVVEIFVIERLMAVEKIIAPLCFKCFSVSTVSGVSGCFIGPLTIIYPDRSAARSSLVRTSVFVPWWFRGVPLYLRTSGPVRTRVPAVSSVSVFQLFQVFQGVSLAS